MKLVIFGATGRTGVELVRQALAAGHTVTAFVRDPAKLTLQDERLLVVQGDVTDGAAVDRAIAGQDAVLTAYGHTRATQSNILTVGIGHIITSMTVRGVRRLVALSGAGVKQPQDPISFGSLVMVPLLNLMAGDMLRDSERYVEAIQNSGLDWVVVRAPVLGDDPAKGTYRTGYLRPGFGRVSRADIADFMLKNVTDNTWLRQLPMVTY